MSAWKQMESVRKVALLLAIGCWVYWVLFITLIVVSKP